MGWHNEKTGEWVCDGKTDGDQPYYKVEGHLFNRDGKHKYTVYLDYSEIWPRIVNGPELEQYIAETGTTPKRLEVDEAAWIALRTATDAGTSDVTIRDNAKGTWTLVVIDPPNGWPVMAN